MATSCHPQHVVKNHPVGELIRIKCNSSRCDTYEKSKQEICNRLQHRAYPGWMLARAHNIVDDIPRERLLTIGNPPVNSSTKLGEASLTFSTDFSLQYNQIVALVKFHLPLLYVDDNLQKVLANGVRFISRRAPNLGSLVSPSYFSSKDQSVKSWQTIVFVVLMVVDTPDVSQVAIW